LLPLLESRSSKKSLERLAAALYHNGYASIIGVTRTFNSFPADLAAAARATSATLRRGMGQPEGAG
jgi:hypothetical protein